LYDAVSWISVEERSGTQTKAVLEPLQGSLTVDDGAEQDYILTKNDGCVTGLHVELLSLS